MFRVRFYAVPLIQAALGVAVLAGSAFAPPEDGDLLLMPLTSAARPVQAARANGSALLGRGPFGSVVVRTFGPYDLVALLRAGILVTAAPASLCGESTRA